MPSRRAFTLVEVLVVTGLIAVLIAILMPALSRARAHANRVKCAANLRSIGQALTMYTQQYRYYPGAGAFYTVAGGPGPAAGGGGYGFGVWPVRLRGFTGGEQRVFHCPARDERYNWSKDGPASLPRAGAEQTPFGYDPGEPFVSHATPFSYGYNAFGTDAPVGHALAGTHRGLGIAFSWWNQRKAGGETAAARVRQPAEMIAIADVQSRSFQDFHLWPTAGTPNSPSDVHLGGANTLFCDGHVQWYLQSDLVLPMPPPRDRPQYDRIARMWNIDNLP